MCPKAGSGGAIRLLIIFWVVIGLLAGCSTSRYRMAEDRAPVDPPDTSAHVEPIPRYEPVSRGGNRNPYTVLGQSYHVLPVREGFVEEGVASWYGAKFHGYHTANGEIYDMYAFTAAHKHLPLPSYVRVTNLANGRQVVVRVNDRGPFHGGRIIDLSYAAAARLDMLGSGTARVRIENVTPPAPRPRPDGSAAENNAVDNVVSDPPIAAAIDRVASASPPTTTATVTATATATAIAAAAPTPGPTPAVAYYAQAASFAREELARRAEALLTDLPAGEGRVIEAASPGGTVYRLQVGPFEERRAAERVVAHLRAGAFPDAFVILEHARTAPAVPAVAEGAP